MPQTFYSYQVKVRREGNHQEWERMPSQIVRATNFEAAANKAARMELEFDKIVEIRVNEVLSGQGHYFRQCQLEKE